MIASVARDGSLRASVVSDSPRRSFLRSSDGVWEEGKVLGPEDEDDFQLVQDPDEAAALLKEALASFKSANPASLGRGSIVVAAVSRDPSSSAAFVMSDDSPRRVFSRSEDGVWSSPSTLSSAEINELRSVRDPKEAAALLEEALEFVMKPGGTLKKAALEPKAKILVGIRRNSSEAFAFTGDPGAPVLRRSEDGFWSVGIPSAYEMEDDFVAVRDPVKAKAIVAEALKSYKSKNATISVTRSTTLVLKDPDTSSIFLIFDEPLSCMRRVNGLWSEGAFPGAELAEFYRVTDIEERDALIDEACAAVSATKGSL